MNKDVLCDLYRLTGSYDRKKLHICLKYNVGFRFLYYWRKEKEAKGLMKKIYRKKLWRLETQTGIEIPPSVSIGEGLMLLHPYNITINSQAVIGDNCVLLKGCTIGNVKDGKYIGTPVIGNNVYIGLNASVVGGIEIGDDVLIAANSFVNRNVPSHSLVFGNPCIIKENRMGVAEPYISNAVSENEPLA